MTFIVSGVKTKKELKALADQFNADNLDYSKQPNFIDPAIVNPINLGVPFTFKLVKAWKLNFVCTNHPKRTWFAKVSVSPTGKVVVK